MTFVTLTHDNQSILSSFSELLSFVTNSLVAEQALSGSTGVGFVYKAWYSFSRLFDLFVASKRLISFITIFYLGLRQCCDLHSQGLLKLCALISNG